MPAPCLDLRRELIVTPRCSPAADPERGDRLVAVGETRVAGFRLPRVARLLSKAKKRRKGSSVETAHSFVLHFARPCIGEEAGQGGEGEEKQEKQEKQKEEEEEEEEEGEQQQEEQEQQQQQEEGENGKKKEEAKGKQEVGVGAGGDVREEQPSTPPTQRCGKIHPSNSKRSYEFLGSMFGKYAVPSGQEVSLFVLPQDSTGCVGPSSLTQGIEKAKENSSIPVYVLIDRGGCGFQEKCATMQRAGADGVLVGNVEVSSSPSGVGGSCGVFPMRAGMGRDGRTADKGITVPCLMVAKEAAAELRRQGERGAEV